jgi:hypothetical protein
MPHPDALPDGALDAIARQIGRRLPRLIGPRLGPATAVTITASLEVWELTAERVEQGQTDLGAVAAPSGRWHHLIAVDGKPALYARTSPPDRDTPQWTVHEVAVTPAAERLDAAIEWLDRNAPGEDLARLLEAPEYHLLCVWLIGDQGRDQVLVVRAAHRLGVFDPQGLLRGQELLDRLRQAEPVVGVELPP